MMIKCDECGSYEPSGALYCGECGHFLLERAEGQAEAPLPFTDALSSPTVPSLIGQEMEHENAASMITVVIPSSGRRIRLPLDHEIQIGRSDSTHGYLPELDFTEDQGSALGVSRRHAVIQPTPEGILLIDEGSTNGTYLNGYHLPPQLPYPLHSGDEVRFGRLLVHIFLE